MLNETIALGIPRCREPDVDPEWWTDPDLYPSDFGMSSDDLFGGGVGDRSNPNGAAIHEQATDQLRAKLFCYECPYLVQCRGMSWNEQWHVWGGMTSRDRTKALKSGKLPHIPIFSDKPANKYRYDAIINGFKRGDSPEDLAATLNLDVRSVMRHIYAAFCRARKLREGSREWKRSTSVEPPKSETLAAFHRGPEDSQSSLVESA